MRAVWASIILVACGNSAPQQPVVRADKPVPPPPPAVQPVVVAVPAGDHVKVLALTPAGTTVLHDVKFPTTPEQVRWVDREHLVAVDSDGKAYLAGWDRVAAYKMPPASAWKSKASSGEKRGTFPTKLTLARSSAGVELASCETYYEGDDDPCVTWGVVSLDTSLDVGPVSTESEPPTDDSIEPEIKPPASPKIDWKDDAEGVHTGVVLTLGTAKREWSSGDGCPFIDANVKWLSETPPIITFVTSSDCGEGGPQDEEHVLRLPALTDFSADGSTIVLGPALWAQSSGGWTLYSGDRVVGSLDGAPLLQPADAPAQPVVATPAQPPASHLALRRGEKLRAPAVEIDWKTAAGAMHATVVDVVYKKARKKPPISKLVVWSSGKRFDIVRSQRACDAFAEVRPAKDMVVFRCGSRPVGDAPEGMVEDWLIRWSAAKHGPLRNKHWSGDPAAEEPAWAKAK